MENRKVKVFHLAKKKEIRIEVPQVLRGCIRIRTFPDTFRPAGNNEKSCYGDNSSSSL